MPIAALPAYLQKQDLSTASPGMRFGMYLPIWTDRTDQETEINERAGRKSREAEELQEHMKRYGMEATITQWTQRRQSPLPEKWGKNDHASRKAWRNVAKLNSGDKALMGKLLERQTAQAALFDAIGDLLRLDALATAPFTTGLGNEHPLENGFAFLNPYGLPYLPGSGVKGVLRQAARELASGEWGETLGWSDEAITALFGREGESGESEHQRGALVFWDVIPQVAGNSLAVEIMTPHQSHYYQHGATPHESGQPTPISFLTVPHGARFVFHIQCKLAFLDGLAPALAQNHLWKALLEAAFAHAYQWLGFGAKTAVGYGAMKEHPEAKTERERLAAAAQAEAEHLAEVARLGAMSPEDIAWEEHQPVVDKFHEQFETARKTAYKPGSLFDTQRNDFLKMALAWADTKSRQVAGELLKATMSKAWGMPGNKDNKQRLQDAVAQLGGLVP